jgi:hypothetical protein
MLIIWLTKVNNKQKLILLSRHQDLASNRGLMSCPNYLHPYTLAILS